MIQSIEIVSDKFPRRYEYIKDLYKIGTKFEFTRGINVIVGLNGSGKSSILNLLRVYTFCNEIGRTKPTSDSIASLVDFGKIGEGKESMMDAAKIIADYRISTFTNVEKAVGNSYNGENIPQSFLYNSELSGKSDGQSVMSRFNSISYYMFNPDFHTPDLSSIINGTRSDTFNCVIKKYWMDNLFKDPSPRFTVLLDEPERNLDIDNTLEVENDLLLSSKNTQMIVSIHNPLLIYRLSKKENINFIELSEGYINRIKKLVEDVKK